MIKVNKQMHKRASTYANYISIGLGSLMIYVPEVVPHEYVSYVMCFCGVTVALCQKFSKDNKDVE